MKPIFLFLVTFIVFDPNTLFSQRKSQDSQKNYIFFLHNKFPEEHSLDEKHPDYGRSEYLEIVQELKKEDFVLITEKRPKNTDVKLYARKVVNQIDSLVKRGVPPNKITVIGTSKGGYIAQYASTYLKNPVVNFVFIGCYQESDLQNFNDINYCGNILTIYEKSDYAGVSAVNRKLTSKLKINEFKEIELNTNLKHGFLFKAFQEWIHPCILWARQDYSSIDKINQVDKEQEVRLDTTTLFDNSRKRRIPIATYQIADASGQAKKQLVIFSHGYGQNQGGDYLAYSYLTEFLAINGFFVVSVQHELPTDSLMPLTGVPQIVRKPFWERGVENMNFVISELRKSNPTVDFEHIILIGHSNGGDMTALFPIRFPNVVQKIVTLDNRRMKLPIGKIPKVYSLRSSDQLADEGVLPTNDELKKYGIQIIKLQSTTHNQMDNNANEEQRKEINGYILSFLTK